MTMAKNVMAILFAIFLHVACFLSFVHCFAGDYNTNPKIRINYLSQNSGKITFDLSIDLKIEQSNNFKKWGIGLNSKSMNKLCKQKDCVEYKIFSHYPYSPNKRQGFELEKLYLQ